MKKLFLFILAGACFLCACDGSVKAARVNALIYDDYLKLDFIEKATPAGDFMLFLSELSLDEIKERVDHITPEVGTMTSGIINGRFLLIEKVIPKDRVNYYLITDITNTADSDKRQYHFSPCYATFSVGDPSDKTLYTIHVPHHLFVFDGNRDYPLDIEANAAYALTGTVQDICAFYRKIKIYDVLMEPGSITVRIKKDAEIFGRHTRSDFVIYFEENDGKIFARYAPASISESL